MSNFGKRIWWHYPFLKIMTTCHDRSLLKNNDTVPGKAGGGNLVKIIFVQ